MKHYLGIDVGSISTNLVLIDENSQVIEYLYSRTDGDPIGAVQKGLRDLRAKLDKDLVLFGVGATGSARQLVGIITGADIVKNEITAHAKGASFDVPDVKTVLEIGGQDSKIIIIRDGIVVDFAMNAICLRKNSLITCNSFAQKPIQQMKRGDKVLTHRGVFAEVEEVFTRKHQGQMIKLEVSNLKSIESTEEHPVLAVKREDIKCYESHTRASTALCRPSLANNCSKKSCTKWKSISFEPKFIAAAELKKGDLVATPLPEQVIAISSINYEKVKDKRKLPSSMASRLKVKINEFILKPDLLRLVGYYLAEGCLLYNKSRQDKKIKYPSGVSFVFNIKEKAYTDDIAGIVAKNFDGLACKISEKPEHKTRIITIHNRSFAEFLYYLGGSLAEHKELNHHLLAIEPDLQKEILKGYFRGDGQLRMRSQKALGSDKTGNRYVASTVSKNLAYQLYWLLLRNSIRCTIRKSKEKTSGNKYVYFITIHGQEANKLEDKPEIVSRKKSDKSFIYKKWLLEPIRKIKKYTYSGIVYNLKVRGDESYVANLVAVHNCAAGTGSFLDAQAYRLKLPIEQFGAMAIKSKKPTTISGRCTIFAESDMIHKQQVGHSTEDIVAGLCQSLVRNYLNNVAKGKDIEPPIVFQGGVSENIGLREAFTKALEHEIIVPKYNTVMGAFGIALIAKDTSTGSSSFKGWQISDQDIKCTSFECQGCPNHCEVIEARINNEVVSRWGDRCGKWSK